MFKKLSAVACSCVTVLLLLLSLIGGAVHTAAASLDEMTSTAISCIMSHEGSYGSVNRNDCGACSIGKLQWHAGRALNLLKSICSNAPDLSQSILGYTFYNEILTATNWNYRTFSVSEGNAVSTLLTTDAGVAAQDALAFSDVQGYIITGQNKGITDAGALVLYADIYNFGSGIASRIASRAAGYAGSYGAVTLDNMYQAALNDSYGSNSAFVQRTNMVYQNLLNANFGGNDTTTDPSTTDTTEDTTQGTTTVVIPSDFSDSYAGSYVVTASALNMRSDPSTSSSVVTVIPNKAIVTVTTANGVWAAITYEGKTGYCSMDYLTIVPDTTTVPAETTTTTTETTTTTTETTTTTIETTTTTEETTTMTEVTTTEMTTTEATETSTTAETTATTVTAEGNVPSGITATLYGDVDGDGEVNAIDAVLLQKCINGMVFLSHEQMVNADCVADGVLDEADVAVILQHLIGRYEALPIY